MKRITGKVLLTVLLLSAPLVMLAQTPPHPNGGNAPGGTNTPVGGGSPLDGGIVMMLVMGAAYGSKKVFRFKK